MAPMMNLEQTHTGWLFSKKTDLFLVWGLLAGTVLLSLVQGPLGLGPLDSLEDFILFKIGVDMAHVFATLLPVLARRNEKRLKTKDLLFYTLFPCLLSLAIYGYSPVIFYHALALTALSHILSQQYGLIMVCRAKAQDPSHTRWLDDLMCFNILISPIIWWFSPLSAMDKSYFLNGDHTFLFSGDFARAVVIGHWLIHACYILHVIFRERRINYAKLSVLYGTWLWLYLSLVILESYFIFWSCLFLYHGLIYSFYCFQDYQTRQKRSGFKSDWPMSLLDNPLIYFLMLTALAAIWFSFYKYFPTQIPTTSGSPWGALIWWPLLIHYSIDSLIWKRSFR